MPTPVSATIDAWDTGITPKQLADRYFYEQCQRLGPIDGVPAPTFQPPAPGPRAPQAQDPSSTEWEWSSRDVDMDAVKMNANWLLQALMEHES